MVKWDNMNMHQRITFKGLVSSDSNPLFKQIYALVSIGGWRYAAGVLYLKLKES